MASQPAKIGVDPTNNGRILSNSKTSGRFNHLSPQSYLTAGTNVGSKVSLQSNGVQRSVVSAEFAKKPSSSTYMRSNSLLGGNSRQVLKSGSSYPEYRRSINYNEFSFSALTATAYNNGHWNDGFWDPGFPVQQLDSFGIDNAARATEVAVTFMPNGKSHLKVSL